MLLLVALLMPYVSLQLWRYVIQLYLSKGASPCVILGFFLIKKSMERSQVLRFNKG